MNAENIFFDGKLIFLKKLSDTKLVKIVVDPQPNSIHRSNVSFKLPKADTMYTLDLTTQEGEAAYKNIIKLKKIR
jgi:hypothetical protein